jgi:hypothetical protein
MAFPWATFAVAAAFAALLIYATVPTARMPWHPLVFVVVMTLLVSGAAQYRQRWVEVVSSDGGRERRASFRRSPLVGWSGASRTRQLCADVRGVAMPSGRGTDSPTV